MQKKTVSVTRMMGNYPQEKLNNDTLGMVHLWTSLDFILGWLVTTTILFFID